MTQPFTLNEIAQIRLRHQALRWPVARICMMTEGHQRDEIIEALDAIRRFKRDAEARNWVNQILDYQAAGIPLINGKPAADSVATDAWVWRPRPMF